ncbi:MAG: hypothetical protein GW794_05610 [Flavobacteriales bacterium]|nr:hypothetical protein [Flavobacteriia bacterium]NCP07000.1 hypothetical protein [Flavobacteriales bacterium]PIV95101.1 MAG: hypothetical protein COW44_00755 [Flavobacteriaceae bacterium CG17_big_fil_post_rev_8_21_14_2_50_33_15]NCP50828.1 hypothetical protein [Flavobacteriales bacterium]NCQ13367.1 hypothetical protein [Flavobacteriales bacterium]
MLSCSTRKQVEKAINTGNYELAIADALDKLKTNKSKKSKEDYVLMLHDAYIKAVDRDLNTIKFLKKDNNPENYQAIYETYVKLNARQEAIKPIMPLQINNKTIPFRFNDYSNDMLQARDNTSDYLYEKGLDLLDSDSKPNIREAYNVYNYIESINPNYEKTRAFMDEAHARGIDYVIVNIENQSNQVVPKRLEDDLLNFDTYGLNQFWTVYHAYQDTNLTYDYAMTLQIKRINISPEQVKETQLVREREMVDGWEYKLDRNGNVKKDSLGNDIKVDKIIKVKAQFSQFNQIKSTQIIGDVVYVDLKTRQMVDTFTLESEFLFQNIFAAFRGDKRALTKDDLRLLNNRRVPFPSNEQMVYDTGEDLKRKLKNIINKFRIRT